MRIIAGQYGGRKLKAVPGMKTRPTTDKVKESMFNIIGPYFDGGNVLDLFAGSGALSIEAVSRGASQAYLIDRQYQAIKTIKENIQITKEPQKFNVLKMDATKALLKLTTMGVQFDYVFLDPPYAQQKIIENLSKLEELNLLTDGAFIICETDQNAQLPETIDHFEMLKKAIYGITIVTIYQYKRKGE